MMNERTNFKRPFVEESPSLDQLADLHHRFGQPQQRHIIWDLRHRDETLGGPSCSGEVVIMIADRESRHCYVAKRESPADWFFPMGRVQFEESIALAAIREAYEETGLTVFVRSIPLLYIVDIRFKGWDLRRWHFIVMADSDGSDPFPMDTEEIKGAAFLDEAPNNRDHFLSSWSKELSVRTLSIPLAVKDPSNRSNEQSASR